VPTISESERGVGDRLNGKRRTSGSVQDHLQHGPWAERGADDVRDSLGRGRDVEGRLEESVPTMDLVFFAGDVF
jgi:hypothetical protein|tara:strand:+ start:20799 stop:21020 length:222 start_codon:yes stop_codon:yes gene_type:complete